MTAPLPNGITTHSVKIVLSSPRARAIKTLDVPLERFSIYRSGFLTAAVVNALENKVLAHRTITIDVQLSVDVAESDVDRLVDLIGLSPLPGPEPTLSEVVRLWPALKLLEARHAVDRCHASLAAAITLDRPETVLAVYLFDVMCCESNVRRMLGRDNVIAPLMPMGPRDVSPTADAVSSRADSDRLTIQYMTLGDRLIDLAMSIQDGTQQLSDGSTDESTVTRSESDLRGAIAAIIAEDGSRAQKAVAEALRDWSLPLHAIDQVFATDLSMARPLTDTRVRWLMATDSNRSVLFNEAIREACPAFADVLLGRDGPLATGVIMAGGAVVNALQKPEMRRSLPGSDIDLWIVGSDHVARVAAFERVIRVLFAAAPGCTASVTGSVVTVHARPGLLHSAPVQVILTPFRSASQVVCGFDMSHACAYYDGNDVYATWSCVCANVTRVARLLPGMVAKPLRVLKAEVKGFTYMGPEPQNCIGGATTKPETASTVVRSAQSAVDGDRPVAQTSATGTPQAPLYSADAVIAAYSFTPLTSDDYAPSDGGNADDVDRSGQPIPPRGPTFLSKRFGIAVPLMTIGWRSAKFQGPINGPEPIGFRLLEDKDAGASIARHRTVAMLDYHEAERNVSAAALKNAACHHKLRSLAQLNLPSGRFAKSGFEFIKLQEGGRCQIVDGITGAPMRVADLDASRHVFAGTLSLAVIAMSPSCPLVHYTRRMERLRVYPRAFVSMAARVMASAAIIAADRFVDC